MKRRLKRGLKKVGQWCKQHRHDAGDLKANEEMPWTNRQTLIAIESRSLDANSDTRCAPTSVLRVTEEGTQCLDASRTRDATPTVLLQRPKTHPRP
jgi:hypothetical protein